MTLQMLQNNVSVMGEEIYSLLRGILPPKTPRGETLDSIIKSFNKHFVTETNTIVESLQLAKTCVGRKY